MASNIINSIDIEYDNPSITIENKVHIVLFAVFAEASNNEILNIGSEGNFKKIIDEIKSTIDSATKIIPIIALLSETNVEITKRFQIDFQSRIDIYINDPQIENIEISVFQPYNAICSLPSILLNYLFWGNKISKDISNLLVELFDEPLKLSNPKIKLNKISPLSLVSIDIQAGIENVQVENIPNDEDARIAAILCEYAYYYLNKKEFDDYEPNNNFWKDRIKRYGSIHNRYYSSKNEIKELYKYLRSKTYEQPEVEDKSNVQKGITDKILKTTIPVYGIGSAVGEWVSNVAKSPKSKNKPEKEENISLSELSNITMADKDIDESAKQLLKALSEWEILEGNDILTVFDSSKLNNEDLKFATNKLTSNDYKTGFSSVFYVNTKKKKCMFCTKGSDFGGDMLLNHDWLGTNLLQGIIGMSGQYTQSVRTAKFLDEKIKDEYSLIFIGHSLGGGLASNNAIITSKRHAITFNAAGLNWFRVPATLLFNNREAILDPIGRKKRIHPFIIKGEILNKCLRVLGEAAYGAGIIGSMWGENIIPPEICKLGCGERHGMINFMTSVNQLNKIKITEQKKQDFKKLYFDVSFKLFNLSFGKE